MGTINKGELHMPLFYNGSQLSIIKESYAFWQPKCGHMLACALLGCEGGETGFIWKLDSEGHSYTPKGDHGEASGIFQWHVARAVLIKERSGYDVINGTHLDMLNGAYAEMTQSWSAYSHVWSALLACKSLWSATNELVARYEQSANQASDDIKRSAIALYMDHLLSGASE